MDTGWVALTTLNLIIAVFSLTKARQQGVKMSIGWMIVAIVAGVLTGLIPFLYLIFSMSSPGDIAIHSLF